MRYTLDDLLARTEQVGDCRLWTGATAGSGYPVARDARERQPCISHWCALIALIAGIIASIAITAPAL